MRVAARLLADPDVAEDWAQETLVGAWRRRERLRDPEALPSWLRRSLVNRIIDRSRRHHDEIDIDGVEANWHDDSYTVSREQVLERGGGTPRPPGARIGGTPRPPGARIGGARSRQGALSQLGQIENLRELAALAGTGLASESGGCRQPCSVRALLKFNEPIEFLGVGQ